MKKPIINLQKKTKEKGLDRYKDFPSVYIICGDCERKRAPTSDLQHHGNIKHVELAALLCDTRPQNNKKLRRHMPDDYSDKEELICQSCDKLFEKEEVLRFHITGIHEDDKDKKENKQPTAMASHDNLPHDRNSRKQTGAELGQDQT